MQMIYRKMFVFPVFVCILENAPENILRCLGPRKMKIKKKKKKTETELPTIPMTNPQPQITARKPKYSKMV
jgi:hypothetical protein